MGNDKRVALVAAGMLTFCSTGLAADRGLEFSGSGFLTLAAGKVLDGRHDPATDGDYACPCFIADYAQGAVYERGGWQWGEDSKLGLQGTASFANGRYALTGQVISRGVANGAMDLEWLYGTFEINGKLTFQLGRKRLPLFAYSEAQDVGYALPWIHLPPQLYGWEIVNYNGANLTWREQWDGGWSTALNVFGGAETRKDAGYWKIYYGKDSRTDSRWSDILGTELTLTRDWLSTRFVYIQSDNQNKQVSAGERVYSPKKHQRIYGVSMSADYGNWIGRAELLYIDRTEDYGKDHAALYAMGYRFGRFLPLVSFSSYRQQMNPGLGAAEAHSTTSLVLRYDLTDASAVKLQGDYWHDQTERGFTTFHGDAHLLTLSYERVF